MRNGFLSKQKFAAIGDSELAFFYFTQENVLFWKYFSLSKILLKSEFQQTEDVHVEVFLSNFCGWH